jgi:hypothetical protein
MGAMGAILVLGQAALFAGCVCVGMFVRSSDVHCQMTAVTVPLPTTVRAEAASPGAEQQVPCDADDPQALGA